MNAHSPVRFVAKNMRLDLALIAGMIEPGSRVLDIGCGDGTLIERLYQERAAMRGASRSIWLRSLRQFRMDCR